MVHTSSGNLLVFPKPPGMESVLRLSDVEESGDSEQDDDSEEESDDEWDDSVSFSSKKPESSYKEPVWEMLTPPNKGGRN